MVEKRFVLCELEYGFANTTNIKKDIVIRDMQEEKTYTIEQVLDLLNSLVDENEQLRQIIKDIVVATDETYAKNMSMFKVTVILDFEKYNELRSCLKGVKGIVISVFISVIII